MKWRVGPAATATTSNKPNQPPNGVARTMSRRDIDSIMNPPNQGHTACRTNGNLFRIYNSGCNASSLTIFYCRIVIIMYTLVAGPRTVPARFPFACRNLVV